VNATSTGSGLVLAAKYLLLGACQLLLSSRGLAAGPEALAGLHTFHSSKAPEDLRAYMHVGQSVLNVHSGLPMQVCTVPVGCRCKCDGHAIHNKRSAETLSATF
jgi:hypothetical protein